MALTGANMTLLLDITRIFRRALQLTPTGIDRVELAYARHYLARHGARCTFIVRFHGHVWPLKASAVPHFLALLAARWDLPDAPAAQDDLRRLETFLQIAPGALAEPGPRPSAGPAPDIRPAMAGLFTPAAALAGALRRPVGEGAVYLNVSHEGINVPGVVEKLARARRWKPIYLIHDLIPLTHPEYVRAGDEAKHAVRMRTVLDTAAAVISNSTHTERMLAAFARREGRAMPRSIVSLLGVEDAFRPLAGAAAELPGAVPYFVMVSTIEPRKNHLLLLHLWRQLAESLGPAAPKLVLVGRRGWENENIVDLLERCPALKDHVLECNRLPDWQLRRLVAGARAMLFPSFAEGFGLPLAEALALGVPVICSDLEVFHEIAGDLPLSLDPLDGPGWHDAVLDFAQEASPRRQAQQAQLGGFRVPSWEQHFAITDALVQEIEDAGD